MGAEGKEGAGRAGGRAPAGRGGAARGRPQSALWLPTPRLRDLGLLPAFPRLGAPLLACLCHAPNLCLHAEPYPTSPGPHQNLGLRPGRGRGRSSRLAGWTPVGVPRHEEPRGAGAHGPWGSLPTPPPHPSPEPPRRSALSRPRARPQLPGPQTPPCPGDCARPARTRFVWFSPRGLFLEFLPFPLFPDLRGPPSRPGAPAGGVSTPRARRVSVGPALGAGEGTRERPGPGRERGWGVGRQASSPPSGPLPRSGPLPPPRSRHALKSHCLPGLGRGFIGNVGTRSSSRITYPLFRARPTPRSPRTIPEGVKTTLTTAPGQEVTGARGGEGGRLVKRRRLAPRPDVRLPTPDVLHLCRTAV